MQHEILDKTHNDPIFMASHMLFELLPSTETRRAYLYAVDVTNGVGTFDMNGVGEVAIAPITCNLNARFF